MKPIHYFKSTLAIALAIVLAWLLSVRLAEAGYTVTLQRVGPDVVATGSGAIDLTGLSKSPIMPTVHGGEIQATRGTIVTGPSTATSVDFYSGPINGPTGFGSSPSSFFTTVVRSGSGSGSGDTVGIIRPPLAGRILAVPIGYVSGTLLSSSSTYPGAILGVTPGTYVWTWGAGADQNFTLQIDPSVLPLPINIINISTRALVQTGDNVVIGGFVIQGTAPKKVLIRVIGPSLPSGVPNPIQDPMISLRDSTTAQIDSNDDWQAHPNASQIPLNLQPGDPRESAILISLQPGAYTAIVSGKGGSTGIALVEVYDMEPGAGSELTNISTRGMVQAGDFVMIGGFVSTGGNSPLLIKAKGPSLAQFGIANVLADPFLQLFDSNGAVVFSNDGWQALQPADIVATGNSPTNDLESAMLIPLAPGAYTAIVTGRNGGTGVAQVEVFKQ